ncbi:thioredoxin family protein [Candidatus Magnetaquicoccus inordinatus]|uniref:thioredoxin family protein n=1 Tax=Candidatus Magnetaquicoccus inordinatus TaxID=2496818 RepID=UPI00102AA2A8|nr:thioredoxin family protein [Candidatus Magnetaquicoccus inordinatus]
MVLLYSAPGTMGAPAADFSLPGVDGKEHALADFAAAEVLVVMFICNHCPYVQAIEGRLIDLAKEMQPLGVAFVAINSNDPISYPEDNMDNMKKRAKERGYPFVYLMDESQDVAHAYGAVCTPDFFIFDRERKLRYRGRLDDSPRNPATVRNQEMKRAIMALLAGEPVAEPQHAAMGCSLKWRE